MLDSYYQDHELDGGYISNLEDGGEEPDPEEELGIEERLFEF